MSDLFLDNETDETTIKYVANELGRLGYNMEELDYIFWQEAYPALIGNLLCLLGVWGTFDANDVTNAVLKQESKTLKIRWPRKLRLFSSLVRKDWDDVKKSLKI